MKFSEDDEEHDEEKLSILKKYKKIVNGKNVTMRYLSNEFEVTEEEFQHDIKNKKTIGKFIVHYLKKFHTEKEIGRFQVLPNPKNKTPTGNHVRPTLARDKEKVLRSMYHSFPLRRCYYILGNNKRYKNFNTVLRRQSRCSLRSPTPIAENRVMVRVKKTLMVQSQYHLKLSKCSNSILLAYSVMLASLRIVY